MCLLVCFKFIYIYIYIYIVMERPYLPSITALLCSSWAYFNEFLIQPSGRGSKCTLESANFSGCIVNVCVSVLIYSF